MGVEHSFVPAGGAGEGEGDELVPEGVVLRYGFCAHQGLEALVVGQIADLASVGAHLCSLRSAGHPTRHCFHQSCDKSCRTRHVESNRAKKAAPIAAAF